MVFGKGYGKDTIMDFDALEGDTIDLSHAVGIKSFNDLMKHHLVDTGHHVKITAGDGSVLIIKNIEPDDLTSDMFLF